MSIVRKCDGCSAEGADIEVKFNRPPWKGGYPQSNSQFDFCYACALQITRAITTLQGRSA